MPPLRNVQLARKVPGPRERHSMAGERRRWHEWKFSSKTRKEIANGHRGKSGSSGREGTVMWKLAHSSRFQAVYILLESRVEHALRSFPEFRKVGVARDYFDLAL